MAQEKDRCGDSCCNNHPADAGPMCSEGVEGSDKARGASTLHGLQQRSFTVTVVVESLDTCLIYVTAGPVAANR